MPFASRQSQPPVLFYQEDRELLLVSRHRERLRSAFRFTIGDATLVEELVDKGRFQALARRLNLPVPVPVARQLDLTRLPTAAEFDVPFPIVIKPLTRRTDRWGPLGGPGKALLVESLDALQQLWPRVVTANVPVLAQQLVPGPETGVESYHVYVGEQGEIVGVNVPALVYGDLAGLPRPAARRAHPGVRWSKRRQGAPGARDPGVPLNR